MSPPCGFGSKLPVARRCASQRITDDTDTPKRPAAARQLIPASPAANARFLKSIASGLPISPPMPASGTESQNRTVLGIPLAIHNEGATL